MLHLETYESFDAKKYKDFLKKYKKSGYISKSRIKSLKDMGIDDLFFYVKETLNECTSFFDKISNNEELLRDIMLEAEDEFSVLFMNIEYQILISPDYPVDSFTIYNNELKRLSETDLMDRIISGVEHSLRKKEIQIDQKVDKAKETGKKLDSWDMWQRSQLRSKFNISNTKITPELILRVNFKDEGDIWGYEGDDRQNEIKLRSNRRYKLSGFLKEIVDRYFNALGLGHINFTIQYNGGYYESGPIEFKVTINLPKRNIKTGDI